MDKSLLRTLVWIELEMLLKLFILLFISYLKGEVILFHQSWALRHTKKPKTPCQLWLCHPWSSEVAEVFVSRHRECLGLMQRRRNTKLDPQRGKCLSPCSKHRHTSATSGHKDQSKWFVKNSLLVLMNLRLF